jgi:hypothetical protein
MNKIVGVALCAAVVGLGGCATRPAVAPSQAASAYRSDFTAPAGSARVYILPTQSKGMFVDLEGRADLLIFPEDSERGAELGSTAKTAFIAFDIAPGSYDLVAHGADSFSKITRLEAFESGRTYFLRPTFFRSAKDVTASGGDTGMGFDEVPPAQGEAEIRSMSMVPLSHKAEDFLRQTYARTGGPAGAYQAAPAASYPAPAAAAPPAPSAPPAEVGETLESKLRTLQRLRHEGLITQPEYDAKRKALLEAY